MSRPARVYVYGYPVAHSLSPAIHNAAFQARRLPVLYEARQVAPAELAAAVQQLRETEIIGANITVPHKEAVMSLVDSADEEVGTIGAANTIQNRAGELRAYNTDASGFARTLAEAQIQIDGAAVLLLGAGGSARAVAQALLRAGAGKLLIANRTVHRAQSLVDSLRARFAHAEVEARSLSGLRPDDSAACSLLVNTTTVGLAREDTPIPSDLLPRDGAVVDIIYNPCRTRLLCEADRARLRTLNGLPMLVHQAAMSWEIWTGEQAPLDVMFSAACAALKQTE